MEIKKKVNRDTKFVERKKYRGIKILDIKQFLKNEENGQKFKRIKLEVKIIKKIK